MSKLQGVRLGLVRFPSGPLRYRVRAERGLAFTGVHGLSREWLHAYILWHQERGEHADARALRQAWLAVSKAVQK